jgi:hypothetical protein
MHGAVIVVIMVIQTVRMGFQGKVTYIPDLISRQKWDSTDLLFGCKESKVSMEEIDG